MPYETPPSPYADDDSIPVDDPDALREIARVFAASFANAGPEKVARHVNAYAATLAKAAQRRRTLAETWAAFGQARALQGGEPLFMGKANLALAHLSFRPTWEDRERREPPNPSDALPTLSDLYREGAVEPYRQTPAEFAKLPPGLQAQILEQRRAAGIVVPA